jgi:hypothetical protein
MKKLPLFVFISLTFLGCHKTKENIISPIVNIENYQIFLDSNQRMVKIVQTTERNKIIWQANYNYTDSLITKTITDTTLDYSLWIYELGQNGFANSSIFTYINTVNKDTITDTAKYYYDSNGYLSSVKDYGNTLNYNYSNGDLLHVETFSFSFYDTLSKIDIYFDITMPPFGNGITGKLNKHLIKKIRETIAGAPEFTFDFRYSFDSNGFVTEEFETESRGDFNNQYLKRFKYVFNYAP